MVFRYPQILGKISSRSIGRRTLSIWNNKPFFAGMSVCIMLAPTSNRIWPWCNEDITCMRNGRIVKSRDIKLPNILVVRYMSFSSFLRQILVFFLCINIRRFVTNSIRNCGWLFEEASAKAYLFKNYYGTHFHIDLCWNLHSNHVTRIIQWHSVILVRHLALPVWWLG